MWYILSSKIQWKNNFYFYLTLLRFLKRRISYETIRKTQCKDFVEIKFFNPEKLRKYLMSKGCNNFSFCILEEKPG